MVMDNAGGILRAGQFWDDQNRKWAGTSYLGISAFPVDWDGDGDFDLLIGCNGGEVCVRSNNGTKTEPSWSTENLAVEAGGKELATSGHAMPVAADWDGDGKFDLVTGSSQGAVSWYRNIGKQGQPKFAAAEQLVGNGKLDMEGYGQRSQVAVADWNADGRMDLLVGDYRSAAAKDGGQREYHGWVWLFLRKDAKAKPIDNAPAGPDRR
jgi:hypothetical protein